MLLPTTATVCPNCGWMPQAQVWPPPIYPAQAQPLRKRRLLVNALLCLAAFATGGGLTWLATPAAIMFVIFVGLIVVDVRFRTRLMSTCFVLGVGLAWGAAIGVAIYQFVTNPCNR